MLDPHQSQLIVNALHRFPYSGAVPLPPLGEQVTAPQVVACLDALATCVLEGTSAARDTQAALGNLQRDLAGLRRILGTA